MIGGGHLSSACLEIESDPAAVGRARDLVTTTLWALGADRTVDDAALVTSELVTNAVLHARTSLEVTIHVVEGSSVRIEVADLNTRPPSIADCPADATTGRGLSLVDAIAVRWGVEAREGGKVVWAELPWPDDAAVEMPADRG